MVCRSDDQCFWFVRVELQAVLHVPLSDVGSTCSKNGQSGGCVVGMHRKTKLRVVSIPVVLNTVACNDVSNWTGVDSEQDGSQYCPWGTPRPRAGADQFSHAESGHQEDRCQVSGIPSTPNSVCRHSNRILWSTVSNAADKSRPVSTVTSLLLAAVSRISNNVLSVECPFDKQTETRWSW